MFITKQEAHDTLCELINTGILKEELEDNIERIIGVLYHEIEDGLNLWGADDEAMELFISVRSDLQTPEYLDRMEKLWNKYKIGDGNDS